MPYALLSYTGTEQSFVVPPHVPGSFRILAVGGRGGRYRIPFNSPGAGDGGAIYGAVSVSPGDVITARCGQRGEDTGPNSLPLFPLGRRALGGAYPPEYAGGDGGVIGFDGVNWPAQHWQYGTGGGAATEVKINGTLFCIAGGGGGSGTKNGINSSNAYQFGGDAGYYSNQGADGAPQTSALGQGFGGTTAAPGARGVNTNNATTFFGIDAVGSIGADGNINADGTFTPNGSWAGGAGGGGVFGGGSGASGAQLPNFQSGAAGGGGGSSYFNPAFLPSRINATSDTSVLQHSSYGNPALDTGDGFVEFYWDVDSTGGDLCDPPVAPVFEYFFTGDWDAVADLYDDATWSPPGFVPLFDPPTPDCLIASITMTVYPAWHPASLQVFIGRYDPTFKLITPVTHDAVLAPSSTVALTENLGFSPRVRSWRNTNPGDPSWTSWQTEWLVQSISGATSNRVQCLAADPGATRSAGWDIRAKVRREVWDANGSAGGYICQFGQQNLFTYSASQVPAGALFAQCTRDSGSGGGTDNCVVPGFMQTLDAYDDIWIRWTADTTQQALWWSTDGSSWTLLKQTTHTFPGPRANVSGSTNLYVGISGSNSSGFGGGMEQFEWRTAGGSLIHDFDVRVDPGISDSGPGWGFNFDPNRQWTSAATGTPWLFSGGPGVSSGSVYLCGTINGGPGTFTWLLPGAPRWDDLLVKVDGNVLLGSVTMTPACPNNIHASVGMLKS